MIGVVVAGCPKPMHAVGKSIVADWDEFTLSVAVSGDKRYTSSWKLTAIVTCANGLAVLSAQAASASRATPAEGANFAPN